MKYDDFKIFKFSTILKSIELIRYNFSRIYKKIKYIPIYAADFLITIIKYIFSGIYKITIFIIRDFSKLYGKINHIPTYAADFFISIIKYIFSGIYKITTFIIRGFPKIYGSRGFGRGNFFRIYKYFDLRKYDFSRIYKYLNVKKRNKHIPVYVTGIIIFLALTYLTTPIFFNYDKSKLESAICRGLNIECSIQGKVKYSFFPSPRIIIKDLIIQNLINKKKKTFGKIENAAVKLSFYNLLNKNKLNFTKIKLQNVEINFDLNELKEYKNLSKREFNSKPINLKNGEIRFFDGKKNIAIIRNINFKYNSTKNTDEATLKGRFLGDNIYINLQNNINGKSPSKTFMLKFSDLNLLTKINILNSDFDKNTINGNVFFKKDKNRLTSIFDYKNDQIIFKNANLKNIFLDGKFNGTVDLLPYFNFNLNVDLNSVNFNRLYRFLIALDEKNKKNLFKINRKINGQLNLSVDKIFSRRTLIHSFESRIKFTNGNILIDQLLLNLGKLGAADITGIINNEKKFTNFKFEQNIFFDNLQRFYNKFGIFNKQNAPSNLFVSGNFDLANLQLRLDEISDDSKFKNEDVVYIEKEFNEVVLENGYESLFNFLKLKEFIKLVTTEAD